MIRATAWPLRRYVEWTRRFGASPPDAYYCIMVRIPMIHRIQACGAMAPMMAGSPRNILERACVCPQAAIYEALKQKEHAIEISS